jgi:acetyltransferase-like isoleucine patch superfamily enzyme
MLAKQVEIRTGDSHSIVDIVTGKRINYASNVILEEYVWVGAHSKILKGVRVGHNSIIGTGAIVTKDIPANSIAAGVPAKVLRSGVDWKRERLLIDFTLSIFLFGIF